MNFDYTVSTKKSFDEAVKSVSEETKKAGFRVLYIHDVAATLAEKNFQIEPFKIIEICNAKSAYTVLKADIKIGLCLPCKISVYARDNNTVVTAMRPQAITQFFPHINLGALGEELDAKIKAIVDSLK